MRRRAQATWGLVVFATACVGAGDVTVVNTEEQIRTSEIQDVFTLLSDAFGAADVNVTPQSPAATAGPQLVPVPVNSTFDVSVPCESGAVTVAGSAVGTLDDQTLEGDLSLQITWDFDGCVVTGDYGAITVNGQPDISFIASYVFGQQQMSVNATQAGGFSYSITDGRSGVCLIDLTLGSTYDVATSQEEQTVSGMICGRPAQEFSDYLM